MTKSARLYLNETITLVQWNIWVFPLFSTRNYPVPFTVLRAVSTSTLFLPKILFVVMVQVLSWFLFETFSSNLWKYTFSLLVSYNLVSFHRNWRESVVRIVSWNSKGSSKEVFLKSIKSTWTGGHLLLITAGSIFSWAVGRFPVWNGRSGMPSFATS